jgi:uncharacterized protein with FMN-binding domain
MKRLIKVGICALIGLILIIALVVYLVPGGDAQARDYLPGTYAAQIILHARPVDVTVTVSEKEITDVQLLNMQADQETFYPLFRPTLDELAKQIIKYQTTKIATTPETAVTSKILLQAVDAALRQAKPEEA